MQTVRVSRGFLLLCDSCYQVLKQDGVVDKHNQAIDHEIIEHLANCHDHNKVLLDDLLGSSSERI